MPQSIPASDIVAINPSVIAAAGSALDLSGLIITNVQRIPVGAMVPFPDAASVAALFGNGSTEANAAIYYFNSYSNSHKKPGTLWFAFLAWGFDAAGWLLGASLAAMPMTGTGGMQSLSGTLSIPIDGVWHNSAVINLSTAANQTQASYLINNAFSSTIPGPGTPQGTFTGTIGAVGATASASTVVIGGVNSYRITVSVLPHGVITPAASGGDVLTGPSVPAGTTVLSQVSGTPGGIGTYVVSNDCHAMPANSIVSFSSTVMTVSSIASGQIAYPGRFVSGSGVPLNAFITTQLTGTIYSTGTYRLSVPAATTSQTMTVYYPLVVWDGITSAFRVQSPTTGPNSSVSAATGSLSTPLKLTIGTGAQVSIGMLNSGNTPRIFAFMDGLVSQTMDWFSFMHSFNVDGAADGTGTEWRLTFAQWAAQQGNRFAYIVHDWNQAPAANSKATGSLGYQLKFTSGFSGILPIWSASWQQGVYKCAFAAGYAASLDFTQTNGRTTFKFRNIQSGGTVTGGVLTDLADVTTLIAAQNLRANGYNFYGQWATANDQFKFTADGTITGPFQWYDSYCDQVWLTNQLQLNILLQLLQIPSIPYNEEGYSLIKAACLGTINQALNFGVIRPGITLSPAQVSAVNNQAGGPIDSVLTIAGWYLQVQDADPATRQARQSPPMTLWWVDGQSIQQIVLGAVEVQ